MSRGTVSEISSWTVQVKVRPTLPASNGPFCDICVSTFSEPAGTAEIGSSILLHNHIHCMYMHVPSTCISTASVYVVPPAIAIHVNSCPCKSSVTRGMVYSNTLRSSALLMLFSTDDDSPLNRIYWYRKTDSCSKLSCTFAGIYEYL